MKTEKCRFCDEEVGYAVGGVPKNGTCSDIEKASGCPQLLRTQCPEAGQTLDFGHLPSHRREEILRQRHETLQLMTPLTRLPQ